MTFLEKFLTVTFIAIPLVALGYLAWRVLR